MSFPYCGGGGGWVIFAFMTKAPPSKTAFMKPLQPDVALAAIVGKDPLPRTELTKKLWEYIRKHGLQDQKDKRNIRR